MDTEIVGSVVWFCDSFFNPISTVPASTSQQAICKILTYSHWCLALSTIWAARNNVVCNPLQWYGQACLCATNDNLTAAGCRPYLFLCGNFLPSFACSQPVSCPTISQTGTDSECIWSKYTTFEVEVGQLTNEYVQYWVRKGICVFPC